MSDPPVEICPHCQKKLINRNTPDDKGQVIICYYCEIEGNPFVIKSPQCGGDKRLCMRENPPRD